MAKKHIMCYLRPIRMAIIKKSINNKCWKKRAENINWYSHYGVSLKN